MSKLFVYRRQLASQGIFSGTYNQPQAISFTGQYGFRLIKVSLSSEIPNVARWADGTRTDLMWITRDAGVNWVQVVLMPGLFTIDLLNLALATAMLDEGWIADTSAPPIVIGANKVNGFSYVQITSANCSPPGSICGINFGTAAAPFDAPAIVMTGPMLGFDQSVQFIGTGLYNATSIPRLDYQGSRIDIVFSFPGSSYENGQPSNLCTEINIPPYNSGVEIVFPRLGEISPVLLGSVPNLFTGVGIRILSATTKRDIEFLYGECYISFEIYRV